MYYISLHICNILYDVKRGKWFYITKNTLKYVCWIDMYAKDADFRRLCVYI